MMSHGVGRGEKKRKPKQSIFFNLWMKKCKFLDVMVTQKILELEASLLFRVEEQESRKQLPCIFKQMKHMDYF